MSTVLVTGGNGFVAAQVIIATINRGYSVVATVRSQAKADQTKQALGLRLGDKIDKLSFAIVPSIEASDAFDEIIKSNQFVAILHTATPFHLKAKDPHEITGPAIASTKNILKSVKEYGPTVKRVIITSSFASITDPYDGYKPGYVYSEKDWNPITFEKTHSGDPVDAYYGAKTWAEKAAWEFIETEKPQFDLVTLCPPMVYGDTAQYLESAEALNTSSAQTYAILTGQQKEVSPQSVMIFVSVRDLAQAHALAIDAPKAGNHRFLITGGNFSHKSMSDAFIKHYPETASVVPTKLPEGVDENGYPVGGYYTADTSLSKELLGLTYTSLEDTMVQFAESVKNLPRSA